MVFYAEEEEEEEEEEAANKRKGATALFQQSNVSLNTHSSLRRELLPEVQQKKKERGRGEKKQKKKHRARGGHCHETYSRKKWKKKTKWRPATSCREQGGRPRVLLPASSDTQNHVIPFRHFFIITQVVSLVSLGPVASRNVANYRD